MLLVQPSVLFSQRRPGEKLVDKRSSSYAERQGIGDQAWCEPLVSVLSNGTMVFGILTLLVRAALRILRLKSHNYFAGLVNVKISKLSTLAAGTGPRRVQIKTPDGWADAHCISLVKISVGYLLCDPPGVAPDSEAWKYKHGVRGAFISGDFDMLFGKLAAIHGHPPGIYFPYVANCCDFVTGNKSSGGGGVVAGGSVPSSLQQPAASSSSPSSFRKNYTDPSL